MDGLRKPHSTPHKTGASFFGTLLKIREVLGTHAAGYRKYSLLLPIPNNRHMNSPKHIYPCRNTPAFTSVASLIAEANYSVFNGFCRPFEHQIVAHPSIFPIWLSCVSTTATIAADISFISSSNAVRAPSSPLRRFLAT
jgi:hypothetical protein